MHPTELTYDDYLEHYGVKGMKWGRRKGSLSSRARQVGAEKKTKIIDRRERVLSGKSSIRDKLIVGSTLSAPRVLLNKGVKNTIAKDIARDKATRARYESGKTTVLDKVNLAMGASVLELSVKRVS